MPAESESCPTAAQRKLVGFALGFAAICAIGFLLDASPAGVARFISAFSVSSGRWPSPASWPC